MSNRSLFEFNHDSAHKIAKEPRVFAELMDRYTKSGSPEDAEDLERFGVRLFGMRRHSDEFSIEWGGRRFGKAIS